MSKRDRFELVGNTIAGTFRVDELVAEGGFGVVYRAFHLHFRSPVALKCLKIPDELTDEERHEFLEQFRSEAEIMFRLSASLPHVVRPLHVDAVQTEQGEFVPLMALEWLDGKSFEQIIEERCASGRPPLALSEAIELIAPAAYALDAAHHFEGAEGPMAVVHRDIKPDNLFLTDLGGQRQVKILDFGISKVRRAVNELAGRASQTSGQAPFSPAYGAPEQWVPKRYGQTGPWTDVWGLALTLVEIAKGEPVIVGDHQAMMGTALDPHVRPTPRTEGVVVCDEVELVFKKAMAVDPRFRYQTVKSFWDALQHALEIGGDPTADESSADANRITLPPMLAPTPWTPPLASVAEAEEEAFGLPPMLDPAPLKRSRPEELALNASFPNNPNSGLAPVPAATHNDDHADFEVPRLEDDSESPPPPFALAQEAPALELQPISVFPGPRELALRNASGRAEVDTSPPNAATPARYSSSRIALERSPSDATASRLPVKFASQVSPPPFASQHATELPTETVAGVPARRVVTRKVSAPDMPSVPDLTPPLANRPLSSRAALERPAAGRSAQRSPRSAPVGSPMPENVSRPPPPRREASGDEATPSGRSKARTGRS